MKFIKKTLLPSKSSSSNIQALCLQHQKTDNLSSNKIQEQLKNQYEQLKKSIKIIKNQHKYQAYLQSFQGFLDVKHNMINKKVQTFMTSLHLSTKKKQKQIPLIQAFSNFSNAEKYKFLIDLKKYPSDLQNKKQQQKSQPNQHYGTPTKKRIHQIQQNKVRVLSDASISLNELKTMSLSYWTKVNFELCLQKRQIKVTGKQSFILYLQNYLIRLSRKQKNCFVLLCCNRDQVPSWLRKVYIHLKSDIFVQVFQSIWTQIIHIQVQKMTASFLQVNNFVENSPAKSTTSLQFHQDQPQMDKEDYLVFLTPFTLKNYFLQKNKLMSKINSKLKFNVYKQIQFNGSESDAIRQKLTKIQFLRTKDEKNKQLYQIKGNFNLPSSVVKFKFINSLKQRNKFITTWQILQTESEASIQAISQTLDMERQFQDCVDRVQQNTFRFKQLFLKEQSVDFNNDKMFEILTLQSLGEISKNSFLGSLVAQCQPKKHQKCTLNITCQFNKNFIKRKLSKKSKQNLSKQQITSINNKVIQIFLKEMILMIFNQDKMYEQKTIGQDQQFFTVCEAFIDDEYQGLDTCSVKSSQNFYDDLINQNHEKIGMDKFDNQQQLNFRSQKLLNFKKVNSFNENDTIQLKGQNKEHFGQLNLRKVVSLQEIQGSNNEENNLDKEIDSSLTQKSNSYLKSKFFMTPKQKQNDSQIVKKGLLEQDWMRLQQGGLTCKNQQKIKEQKQIIKKILMKLGENLLRQKNIIHVSLPVTIFKPESQLVTVARGLTYAPLLLQPHGFKNDKNQMDAIQRVKKAVVFLLSNNYAQINFEKPFNPILGETYQGWIDGCPVYFQQISHHPAVTYYNMLGRGYKIYGAIEPSLSMGINHAKVTSWTVDCIEFDDGTKINAGPNKMMVNGTTFGLRTFNLDEKNFIYDLKNNILAVFSYGPTKKGLFSTSSQPLDFITGKIMRMTYKFQTQQYQKWRKNMDYNVKKQLIEIQICSFEGLWNQKIFFDGIEYFDFNKNLPFQLIQQKNPLPSDCRYRQDLQWLIKKDLQKSQFHKERMQQQQRRDKKLRNKNK